MDRYILWDLDGTIVESEDITFKTEMFKDASKKQGLVFEFEPHEFIGHEAKNIYKILLERNNISKEREVNYWSLYDNWYEDAVSFIKNNVSQIKPRENIIDLWHSISDAGIINAIVTSSREDVAHAYLKNIGLFEKCSLFTCINHVTLPKPNPEPYLMAMQKLNITIKNCIAIEDSFSGIKSAKDAGVYTIAWVKDIENPNYSNANLVTKSLSYNLISNVFEKELCQVKPT